MKEQDIPKEEVPQKYRICAGLWREELEEMVNRSIMDGYQPVGGVSVFKHDAALVWVQAVVKK